MSALQNMIVTQRCRMLTILGIGGIGKTCLAAKLARSVRLRFDAVIWRSVRSAPPLETLLQDIVPFLSRQQDTEPTVAALLRWLQTHRCRIVLDNVETLLSGGQSGQYRTGYEGYGDFFRQIGQTRHQSCLIVTGREKPADIGAMESDTLAVGSIRLRGSSEAARAIIRSKNLFGSAELIQQMA